MKKERKGFTLVELLVVIAIVSILASVTTLGYIGFVTKANLSSDKEEASQMSRSLQYLMTSNEDLEISDYESLNEALKLATDNTFDLDTYKLRSADKGYNLWFNTKTNTFEVAEKLEGLEAISPKKASRLPNESYAGVEAFLWSDATPYLYVTTKGNELASAVESLKTLSSNTEEVNLKGVSKVFKDKLTSNAYVTKDGSVLNLNKEVNTKDKLLFSKEASSIKEVGNLEINHVTIPHKVNKVEAGAFFETKLTNVVIKNKEAKVDVDAFNKDAIVNIPSKTIIKDMFVFASDVMNIKRDDLEIVLNEDKLSLKGRPEQFEQVNNEVNPETIERMNTWSTNVKNLANSLLGNYDIYAHVDNILTYNTQYNNLKNWEKSYLKANYQASFDLFYHETKEGNKLSLNETTGIYDRYEIYNGLIKIFQASNLWENDSLKREIKTNDVNIFNELVSGFNNEIYAINVTLNNDATSVNLNNLLEISSDLELLSYDSETGMLINNMSNLTGEVTIIARNNQSNVVYRYYNSYGIEDVRFLIPALNTNDRFNLTAFNVGKNNNFAVPVRIGGNLEKPLTTSDIELLYADNKTIADFRLEQIAEGNNNDYVLYVNLKNVGDILVEHAYELKIRIFNDNKVMQVLPIFVKNASNITNHTEWSSNHNGDYVLNTNLILATSGLNEGYSIENGLLTYSANVNNPRTTFENATLFGNNYKVDASKITVKANGSSDQLITLKTANIENLRVLLASSQGYLPTDKFNIAASGVCIEGNSSIKNSYFSGSTRGLRIKGIATLENLEFSDCMTPIEIYSVGTEATERPMIIHNVKVNSAIYGSKQITKGMGILFFPGNSGSGITTMNQIKLDLVNFDYDGSFTRDETSIILTQVIGGLMSSLPDWVNDILKGFLNFDSVLEKVFHQEMKIWPNNDKPKYPHEYIERLSPAIIVPTELVIIAILKNINVKFDNFGGYKNTIDTSKYRCIEASKFIYPNGASFGIFIEESKTVYPYR